MTDAKLLLQDYLTKNGYTKDNPLTINLVYNTGNTRRQAACVMMADSIKSMDLPITVKVQDIVWATFLDKQRNGEIDMFAIGWLADYPTADDFIGPFDVSDILYARQVASKRYNRQPVLQPVLHG